MLARNAFDVELECEMGNRTHSLIMGLSLKSCCQYIYVNLQLSHALCIYIMSKKIVVFKVMNMCVKNASPFCCFFSICRMNCYVICLFNYSCHFILEETYVSNITSFPALSVFMFTNV